MRSKNKQYQRIYAIIENWLQKVESGDSKDVSKLYAEDGVLLGTMAANIKQGRRVIKTYFDTFLKKNPIGMLNSIVFQALGDEFGIADGNYTFELDEKGKRVFVSARYTFVVNLDTGLIMTHHSSSNPNNTPV